MVLENKVAANTKYKYAPNGLGRLLSQYAICLVLLCMIVFLALFTNSFFTVQNIINVLRQVSINGVMAMGVTLIIVTGGIDLSLGSMLAFAGVVATSFAHPEPHCPLIIIILVGIVVGGICGMTNGFLVAHLKIPAFIATLGMTTVARGAALVYSDGRPIIDLSPSFKQFGQGSLLGVPVPIYVFVAVIILSVILLHKTRFGRYIYAIGGNQEAAKASGVNIKAVLFSVYAFAGILCGVAGVMLASRTGAGAPNAGSGYELDAIAAAVLGGTSTSGGKGTIVGTIAGILIMGILSNGLDILNVSSYIQQIIKGVIIVGAVLLDQINKK